MPGALIAFEGMDQSGKATQSRQLRARLEATGHRVESLSFPDYKTAIGMEIGRALQGERDYGPDTMQLLYIANRYEWRPRIEQWLADGRIVICDRYAASSVAYGESQGLDPAWVDSVQTGLPKAAVTVLLDLAADRAASRKQHARDKYERDLAMLGRVRESYQRQARQQGWVVLDGARPVEEVAADVARLVLSRLSLSPAP
jgi:dTMP kinase